MSSGDRRQLVAVITADAKGLEAALNEAGRKGKRGAQKMGRDMGKELQLSFKRGFGSATDLIGLGGAAGIMAAGKQVLDFQTRLTRLQQSSRATKGQIMALEQSLFALGKQRGLDPDQLLGAAERYVQLTGDLGAFTAAMDGVGKVAAATGADLEDVSAMTAALSQQFGILPGQTEKAFDVLAAQGQRGAIEIKDAARYAGELAATYRMFADSSGLQGMADMGALFQMSAGAFNGNAEKSKTGLDSLMGSVIRSTKKIEALGIKMKGKSLADILFAIDKKKLNAVQLQDIFSDKEGFKAFNKISQLGSGRYNELRDQGTVAGTIQAGSDIWDQSPAKKVAAAQAKLRQVLNNTLTKHIDTIAIALEKMASALELAVKHWKLLAAVWVASKLTGGNLVGTLGQMAMATGPGKAAAGKGQAMLGAVGGGKGIAAAAGKAGMVVAAAAAGVELGTWLNDNGYGDWIGDGLNAMWDRGEAAGAHERKIAAMTGMYGEASATVNRRMGSVGGAARVREMRERGGIAMFGHMMEGNTKLPSTVKAATEATDEMVQRLLARSGLSAEHIGEDNFALLQNISDKSILAKSEKYEDVKGAAKSTEAELAVQIRKLAQAIEKGGIASLDISTNADVTGLNIRRKGE